MSSRASLVETVTERLLDRVVSGEFGEGDALPPEPALAEQSGASRLTVREAVKVLASQNVLSPVQGRGTYVNPVTRWTSLEALVRVQRGDASKVIAQLVEVRGMIEVGAAELFAGRTTDAELEAMGSDLAAMREAHARTDVDAFRRRRHVLPQPDPRGQRQPVRARDLPAHLARAAERALPNL
jgi:GntR family transcriptional repressor for pyruvate dehydrogenase complex